MLITDVFEDDFTHQEFSQLNIGVAHDDKEIGAILKDTLLEYEMWNRAFVKRHVIHFNDQLFISPWSIKLQILNKLCSYLHSYVHKQVVASV